MENLAHNTEWAVLYTRFNFERQICHAVQNLGFTGYLPVCKTVRQWKDRKKKLEIPLFSCYLFIKLPKNDIHKVLQIKGAIDFIKHDGRLATVDQDEIDTIRRIELGNPEVSNECFTTGTSVCIQRGPLKGLNGKIVNIKGKLRLGVVVEVLNKYILVDVSPSDLSFSEVAAPLLETVA
jgi:transcription antitermination factor NusG